MPAINSSEIEQAIAISNLVGFTGRVRELGGGEVNDTAVLDCGNTQVVLRISRYDDVHNLQREANALRALDLEQVPKLLFFDGTKLINGRQWILESYIEGGGTHSLTTAQYKSLGRLLAKVHSVTQEQTSELNYWNDFLDASQHFGTEQALLDHPDRRLAQLIHRCHDFLQLQGRSATINKSLTHGDVTPSNMLVNGDEVSLIDWEFSGFKDPMADFSTFYYDDMEYNKGKWRIHIKPHDKSALFEGYAEAGGTINEDRLTIWQNIDKLGAAVYLYWKVHQSGHAIDKSKLVQYNTDLANLTGSLEHSLSLA